MKVLGSNRGKKDRQKKRLLQSGSLHREVLLFACALMFSAGVLRAENIEAEPDRMADDFITVSLLVADAGDMLYSILGHAALRLQCPYYELDYVYSYESEGVSGKVGRFLMNDLKMGMIAMPLADYLNDYAEEGRGVKQYTLNLPPEVKTELWRVLDLKRSEGIMLEYDYIKRGCAISVVHSLNEAITAVNRQYGERKYSLAYPEWGKPFERTLREIVYDNAPKGWQRFYGMTLVGGQVDNPDLPKQEKLIIPRELVATWEQTTIDGKKLIDSEPVQLLPAINEYKGDRFTPLHAALIILLLALVSLFWSKPYLDLLILALQTALGCLMLWLLISPLPGSEWSWLIIPFNPLPAILWHWHEKWGVWYAAVIVIWTIGVLLAPHRLVEYAHIVFALAFSVVLLKPLILKKSAAIKRSAITTK